MGSSYRTLEFSDAFLESFASKDFSAADRSAFLKALRLLDGNDGDPSLRVHELRGDRREAWSVSASQALRMTFVRAGEGRKIMLTCSRHHDRG